MKILSNTIIHEEFINDEARQQWSRPYQPSSGLKYKHAECLMMAGMAETIVVLPRH
jgi:hypothetical protein